MGIKVALGVACYFMNSVVQLADLLGEADVHAAQKKVDEVIEICLAIVKQAVGIQNTPPSARQSTTLESSMSTTESMNLTQAVQHPPTPTSNDSSPPTIKERYQQIRREHENTENTDNTATPSSFTPR